MQATPVSPTLNDSSIDAGLAIHDDLGELAHALIRSRQNVSPKRLVEPGPSPAQIEQMLTAAAAAPDHGMLRPWRFVIVPQDKRTLLGEVFGAALTDRDPNATQEQIAEAREKANRAPFVMLAIARLGPDDAGIPEIERVVSLGCALQNILLSAHAMGFGGGLTSGKAMQSPRMRELFQLTEGEQPVCCVNVGTVSKRKRQRSHPAPSEFCTTL